MGRREQPEEGSSYCPGHAGHGLIYVDLTTKRPRGEGTPGGTALFLGLVALIVAVVLPKKTGSFDNATSASPSES